MRSELADEVFQPPLIRSDVVFDGMIWGVRRDEFDFGAGPITREYLEHPGAVAVLTMDEEGRVLLIRQYRHPIRSKDWELPAGLLDVAGEDPLQAAQRELAEEVDLAATTGSVLTDFFTSPGSSSESVRVYLATGLTPTRAAFDRRHEEADIEKRWVSLDETVEAVLRHRVHNAILSLSVLTAAAVRR